MAGFIEDFVGDMTELSVMVARSADGEIAVYDSVEMVFNQSGNLLDCLFAPARLSPALAEQARQLGANTVASLNGTGVFGVEMFLTVEGELLINELAPRTHNSGHYTIDACTTSQFEQQYRILTGQPLGSVAQSQPAVMFNLLGEQGFKGNTVIEGRSEVLAMPGVKVYLYGKSSCFPLRKMGHVTVLGDTLEDARRTADSARRIIRVRGEQRIDSE